MHTLFEGLLLAALADRHVEGNPMKGLSVRVGKKASAVREGQLMRR